MPKHVGFFLLGALLMSSSIMSIILLGGLLGLLIGTTLGFVGNISTSLGYGHVVRKLEMS